MCRCGPRPSASATDKRQSAFSGGIPMHPENEAARTGRSSEVPPQARELTDTLGRDYEQRQSKAAETLERAIVAGAERARAQIHDLVRPELRRALQDLKRRERLAFQQRTQPPLDAGITF